jgi:hypothetical protein
MASSTNTTDGTIDCKAEKVEMPEIVEKPEKTENHEAPAKAEKTEEPAELAQPLSPEDAWDRFQDGVRAFFSLWEDLRLVVKHQFGGRYAIPLLLGCHVSMLTCYC